MTADAIDVPSRSAAAPAAPHERALWQRALRFLLGVFEAGFYPGIILYLTYWFPGTRRAKAFGMFMSASAFAGVIGGPLAGTIMTGMHGVNGWSGWQWVLLIEGIPSVIAGFVTYFYLTDRPEQASWLTPRERQLVHDDLERDGRALGQREHSMLASLRSGRICSPSCAVTGVASCANASRIVTAPRRAAAPSPPARTAPRRVSRWSVNAHGCRVVTD